ncbi:MAG: exonuclease domain-containing protein [Comamonas sp.]|nr:exonuclease domain-containing protein [Comamonas sp.]
MQQTSGWVRVAIVLWSAMGVWLLALGGLTWLALEERAQRTDWATAWQQVAPLWGLCWALGGAALLGAWYRWVHQPRQAWARLAEQGRVLLTLRDAPPLPPQPCATQAMAKVLQELVVQRDDLQRDMQEEVRRASGRMQQEKEHLAALLAELQQAVLVCNLDGRILLCNHLARAQWGAGAVGIGRSVYGLLDRALLHHALHSMQQRLERAAVYPGRQFVTHTQEGRLLRVQMTPVLAAEGGGAPGDTPPDPVPTLTGFMLLLEDITHSFAEEQERDHMLHSVTEGNRASLGAVRAALAALDPQQAPAASTADDGAPPEPHTPTPAPTVSAVQARLWQVVHTELGRVSARIEALAQHTAAAAHTRWPLEPMLGQELVSAAQQHMQEQLQHPIATDTVQDDLWLRVDGYSLLQALTYLGERLIDEFAVRSLRLRLLPGDGRYVYLDLVWVGHAMSTETVMSWEMDPMQLGAEHSTLSVRDVVQRHGGAMGFERERASHQAYFRFQLPQGSAQAPVLPTAARVASRPEFYDFDLFQQREADSDWNERPLRSLRFTVFDTETTGLNPSEGDQILQIGAVRIVNGRLLAHECYEQLVHPGRDIPEAGIPIHGITPEMVADQPRIEAVLPVFHRFAADSVLVAHNAAFDMKFLQLLEPRTGVVFDQPVLDTLLLSVVAHPHQTSHRLEALAERFGLNIMGRHTALGDAMVTAEVWLCLLEQLEKMGIHTLGQARAAAQQTYYARLKY